MKILILLFSFQAAWAAGEGQQTSEVLCTNAVKEIFNRITPKCTWVAYPDKHPLDGKCFISCEHNDAYIGQRNGALDAATKIETEANVDSAKFPFRFERVDCPAIEECNKEPQKCLDDEKKKEEQSCKDKAKEEEKWHLDPAAPLPAGTENYRPPPEK